MKETKEVLVTEKIYNLYDDEYDVTAEALDRAFPEFKISINPMYEFARFVNGRQGNSEILLGDFYPLFKKIEKYKSSGVDPQFPFGQKVEYENYFKKDLELKNISVLVKKKYYDRKKNKRYKFQFALKHALSKKLKKSCKPTVINKEHLEKCESCKRPLFREFHQSIQVFDEKTSFDMEILPKTDRFVENVKKLTNGEKLGDVVVELRVPKMFLKGN